MCHYLTNAIYNSSRQGTEWSWRLKKDVWRLTPKHLAKLPHAQEILGKSYLEEVRGKWSTRRQTEQDTNFSTSTILVEIEFQVGFPWCSMMANIWMINEPKKKKKKLWISQMPPNTRIFKISGSLRSSFFPYLQLLSLLFWHDLMRRKRNVSLWEHSSVVLSQSRG